MKIEGACHPVISVCPFNMPRNNKIPIFFFSFVIHPTGGSWNTRFVPEGSFHQNSNEAMIFFFTLRSTVSLLDIDGSKYFFF